MDVQSTQPINWRWCAAIPLIPIALGIGALINLLQSPADPNCQSDSLSSQEATSIFYCANMLAAEQDVEKLHQAVQLINNLPKDNPLRNEKLLEKWSLGILEQSENAAQAGELNKAIDIANMIPANIPAHKIAVQKIQRWKSIWSQAEAIDQAAKEIIKKNNRESWYLAIQKAKELRKLDNQYWANTKYQELIHYIQDITEKDEQSKLIQTETEKSLKSKETDFMSQDLQVPQESDFMKKLLAEQEAEDNKRLQKARMLANSGKIADMNAAIDEANMIISDKKYAEAQEFIRVIKNKVDTAEDNLYLQEAKKIALKNDELSLQLAITRASLISSDSALYAEASNNIDQWKDKLLTLSSLDSQPQPKETIEPQESKLLNP